MSYLKRLIKFIFGNKQKVIKSFISVGDIIEVNHHRTTMVVRVDIFEVIANSIYPSPTAPTEFVIYVKFSYGENFISSIECTSDSFTYTRHISHSK